jgi:hypothetical protein
LTIDFQAISAEAVAREVAEVAEVTSVTSALCGRYLRRHLPEVKNVFTVQQEQINELKHT